MFEDPNIKTMMRYHLMPTRMVNVCQHQALGRGREQGHYARDSGGSINWYSDLGKKFGIPCKMVRWSPSLQGSKVR